MPDVTLRLRLLFEPHALWIGVYWNYSPRRDKDDEYDYAELSVYICAIPMLLLRLRFWWDGRPYEGAT